MNPFLFFKCCLCQKRPTYRSLGFPKFANAAFFSDIFGVD